METAGKNSWREDVPENEEEVNNIVRIFFSILHRSFVLQVWTHRPGRTSFPRCKLKSERSHGRVISLGYTFSRATIISRTLG